MIPMSREITCRAKSATGTLLEKSVENKLEKFQYKPVTALVTVRAPGTSDTSKCHAAQPQPYVVCQEGTRVPILGSEMNITL
jgi:hypothetical protein